MKRNPSPTLPLSGEGVKSKTLLLLEGVDLLTGGVRAEVSSKVEVIAPPPAKGEVGRGLKTQNKLHNLKSKMHHRKQNRKNPTEPEKLFWSWVRGKQLGCKFRRQHGIGQYIVDFYCAEHALIIELDGDSHYTEEGIKSDTIRSSFLKDKGFSILRFTNAEIMKNKEGVLIAVSKFLSLEDHCD